MGFSGIRENRFVFEPSPPLGLGPPKKIEKTKSKNTISKNHQNHDGISALGVYVAKEKKKMMIEEEEDDAFLLSPPPGADCSTRGPSRRFFQGFWPRPGKWPWLLDFFGRSSAKRTSKTQFFFLLWLRCPQGCWRKILGGTLGFSDTTDCDVFFQMGPGVWTHEPPLTPRILERNRKNRQHSYFHLSSCCLWQII